MILLDTCAFLWLVTNYRKLSSAAIDAIENCDRLGVSPITALEIAIKHRTGKITLPHSDASQWYQEVITHWELREEELNSKILIDSALLPMVHKDPFDRIIVATALLQGASIITADETIGRYPDVNVIW